MISNVTPKSFIIGCMRKKGHGRLGIAIGGIGDQHRVGIEEAQPPPLLSRLRRTDSAHRRPYSRRTKRRDPLSAPRSKEQSKRNQPSRGETSLLSATTQSAWILSAAAGGPGLRSTGGHYIVQAAKSRWHSPEPAASGRCYIVTPRHAPMRREGERTSRRTLACTAVVLLECKKEECVDTIPVE